MLHARAASAWAPGEARRPAWLLDQASVGLVDDSQCIRSVPVDELEWELCARAVEVVQEVELAWVLAVETL